MIKKLDITTIILTYNEELHIRRCLENVCPFSKKVYVIDSPSTDRTVQIVQEVQEAQKAQGGADVELIVHKYPGNQAAQYNWAIDNLKIETEWVLRIDADEYLLPELVNELQEKVPNLDHDVASVELKRRHIFMGKWVRHGGYPTIMMRMHRNGKGRYDNRLMDEHMVLMEGKSVMMDNDFCDHSLVSISAYCQKHIGYASREAASVLDDLYELTPHTEDNMSWGEQAQMKHRRKGTYNKLPLFWRSFAYFIYRYFISGLILDGKQGFLFAFVQGWWYRTLVDAKILECRMAIGFDRKAPTAEEKVRIKEYIKTNWKISL